MTVGCPTADTQAANALYTMLWASSRQRVQALKWCPRNETFIPITGRWRFEWEVDDRVEAVELGPLDTIAMPAGVNRRFMNISSGKPGDKHLLLGIIGGDNPGAEFSEGAMEKLREKGLA
jgi:hypothetical protein